MNLGLFLLTTLLVSGTSTATSAGNLDIFKWPTFAARSRDYEEQNHWDTSQQQKGPGPIQHFARFRDETFRKIGMQFKQFKNRMNNRYEASRGRGRGYPTNRPSHYGQNNNNNNNNGGYFEVVRRPNPGTSSSYSSLSSPVNQNTSPAKPNSGQTYQDVQNTPLSAAMAMGSLLEHDLNKNNNPEWTPVDGPTGSKNYGNTANNQLQNHIVSSVINGSFLPTQSGNPGTVAVSQTLYSPPPTPNPTIQDYLPPNTNSGGTLGKNACISICITKGVADGPFSLTPFDTSNLARGHRHVSQAQETINAVHRDLSLRPPRKTEVLSPGEQTNLIFGSLLEQLGLHIFMNLLRRANLESTLSSEGMYEKE